MEPIYLSEKSFSRHVKLIKKPLSHYKTLKFSQIRDLLASVYGFDNDYDYRRKIGNTDHKSDDIRSLIQSNYPLLVERFAHYGNVDGQVAKHLVKLLWGAYLSKDFEKWRQYQSHFIFDDKLVHFLRSREKLNRQVFRYDGKPSLKDAIESQGIPHISIAAVCDENETILDTSVGIKPDQTYRVLASGSYLKGQCLKPPQPPGDIKFVVDISLGKLAKYLRMLGFDILFPVENMDDAYLAHMSVKEDRIMLTRDKGLLKRSILKYGYWVSESNPLEQLKEVIAYYSLQDKLAMFSRCMNCNTKLDDVEKKNVVHLVPELIARDYEEFKQCPGCQQVYWKGSHVEHMQGIIDYVTDQGERPFP